MTLTHIFVILTFLISFAAACVFASMAEENGFHFYKSWLVIFTLIFCVILSIGLSCRYEKRMELRRAIIETHRNIKLIDILPTPKGGGFYDTNDGC